MQLLAALILHTCLDETLYIAGKHAVLIAGSSF